MLWLLARGTSPVFRIWHTCNSYVRFRPFADIPSGAAFCMAAFVSEAGQRVSGSLKLLDLGRECFDTR